MADFSQFLELQAQLVRRKRIYKLDYYEPVSKQMEFHNGIGKDTDLPAEQRLLLGGNQVGKTYCGSMEAAMHLTGRYPKWYKGIRYRNPITMMCGGVTNASCRDIIQKSLFGNPLNEEELGTGSIPIDCIGTPTKKSNVPNAYDSCTIRHFTDGIEDGMSNVYMRGYEQGFKAFMGIGFQVGWMDEEPPEDIYSQFLRATMAQITPILYITATPEEGMTKLVTQFISDLQKGQFMTTLRMSDCKHYTEADIERIISKYPAREREMRKNGSPLMGAGLVFGIPDEEFVIDPIPMKDHFYHIIGIDFGWTHPFGASHIVWDRDEDIVYIVDDYSESKALPAVHALSVKHWGDWIPVAWPHDGMNAEKGTGDQMKKNYQDAGMNLLPNKATNPPQEGEVEGEGGNSVEASLLEMNNRLMSGRLKVFKTCTNWLREKSMYHYQKNGKLLKQGDDVISSSRYAIMMLRMAKQKHTYRPVQHIRKGHRNFGSR